MQHTLKKEFEVFDASAYSIGIVVATFNYDISNALLLSAREMCARYGIAESAITVHLVPGVVEIPIILQALAETKRYNCLAALGTIVRGDTPHFDYVAKIVSEGVLRASLDNHIPIGFGVLTCDDMAQAEARTDTGGSAVEAALQSARILEALH